MTESFPRPSQAIIRNLTFRMLGLVVGLSALLGIAMITLLLTISSLDEEADALDRVGAQRMMAQRVVVLADRLVASDQGDMSRQRYRDELEKLEIRLREDARWLIANPDVPPEVATLYATAWDDEAGVMTRFHAALRDILDGRGSVSALNHREAMLFNEEAARRYHRHTADEVDHLKLVATTAFILLLTGLLLLYLLVLRPAIATVRQQVRRQAALGDAIVQSGHGVLLLDDHGVISFANAYAESLTDYGPEQLIGVDLGRLLFSAYGEDTADKILESAARATWRDDVRLIRRSGVTLWAEMVVSAAVAEGGYLVIFFDATQRREAEAKLRQARERLSAAIEAVDDGFALFDVDEKLVLCNRRFATQVPQLEPWIEPGVSLTSLLTQAWKLGVIETDLNQEQFIAQRLAQFRIGHGQSEHRLTDGRILHGIDRRTPEGGRVCVVSDVTAAIGNRDHLRRALEQAEAANRSKTVFLSSMSHELRTPLNAILGFAQLLEGTPDGQFGAAQRRSVGHILRAGSHLTELISQVLELAELESGTLRLTMADFDLAAVVLDCAGRISERLHAAGLSLRISGCERPVAVRGDFVRMAEVIGHLLSNAIKFNKPKGWVEIRIENVGPDTIRLSVSDCGRGIAAALQPQVFQPFNRLGVEGANIEGAGIGLTISRVLVEQMGGRIGFSSREGQGSTFWVDLLADGVVAGDVPSNGSGRGLAVAAASPGGSSD